MEVEGLITHSIRGLLEKVHSFRCRALEMESMIEFWSKVLKVHLNEELKAAIKDIKHVKVLFGVTEYMRKFIEADVGNELSFMGYSLEHIQFYIELRDSLGK